MKGTFRLIQMTDKGKIETESIQHDATEEEIQEAINKAVKKYEEKLKKTKRNVKKC